MFWPDIRNPKFREVFPEMNFAEVTTNNFFVCHLNIRSLNANVDNLKQLLNLLCVSIDIIVLTEIWSYNVEYFG